jgi:hypothetical protein
VKTEVMTAPAGNDVATRRIVSTVTGRRTTDTMTSQIEAVAPSV